MVDQGKNFYYTVQFTELISTISLFTNISILSVNTALGNNILLRK